MSALNRARRALSSTPLASLRSAPALPAQPVVARICSRRRSRPTASPPPRGPLRALPHLEQAEAALDAGADGVYLDFLELTGTGDAVRALRARTEPRSSGSRRRASASRAKRRSIATSRRSRPTPSSCAASARCATGGGARRAARILAIGDFSLNVTNRSPPPRCSPAGSTRSRPRSISTPPSSRRCRGRARALRRGRRAPPDAALPHGALRDRGAALRGPRPPHLRSPLRAPPVSLRDRAGMDHPVEADVGCRNTVFHAQPQSAAELVPALRAPACAASASSWCARTPPRSTAGPRLPRARRRRDQRPRPLAGALVEHRRGAATASCAASLRVLGA